MNAETRIQRRAQATDQFNQRLGRGDGERIVGSMSDGLGLLAEMFLTRVHVDVQRRATDRSTIDDVVWLSGRH